MNGVTGKTVIVTGAGSGIGRATALMLGVSGANVALVGRRLELLDALAEEFTDLDGEALPVRADLTSATDVASMVETVWAKFGPVDVLVNNAARSHVVMNARWLPHDEWRALVDANLNAVFYTTQAVLDGMLERGTGQVITVSSMAALNPSLLGGAAYGAAKAGVRNFMTYLHNTFRNDGLRFSTVIPGETDTPILDDRPLPPGEDTRAELVHPEDVAEVIHMIAGLPPRALIQEVTIIPSRQRDQSVDLAFAREFNPPTEDR